MAQGHGAAWVLTSSPSGPAVVRIDADTGVARSTPVPANAQDVAVGPRGAWSLSATAERARVVRLDSQTGARRGAAIEFAFRATAGPAAERRANTIEAGAGRVWVAGVGSATRIASIVPSSARVEVRRIAEPAAFAVADGALWTVTRNQRTLLRRDARSLRVTRRVPLGDVAVGAERIELTAGLGQLWMTTRRPTGSAISLVSPSTGLVPGVGYRTDGVIRCTTTVAGAVWPAVGARPETGAPAFIAQLALTDLFVLDSDPFPPTLAGSAQPCVTGGGGFLWATDGINSVYQLLTHPRPTPIGSG